MPLHPCSIRILDVLQSCLTLFHSRMGLTFTSLAIVCYVNSFQLRSISVLVTVVILQQQLQFVVCHIIIATSHKIILTGLLPSAHSHQITPIRSLPSAHSLQIAPIRSDHPPQLDINTVVGSFVRLIFCFCCCLCCL